VACPYFYPEQRHEAELWMHRGRLPLGDGFQGKCMAPGCGERTPSDEELKDFCNLGYASGCGHIPQEREADAVHFAACDGKLVQVKFVTVREHAAARHGVLEFDAELRRWKGEDSDPTLQRMADVYVEGWLRRRGR
jgi:hypothetical protein